MSIEVYGYVERREGGAWRIPEGWPRDEYGLTEACWWKPGRRPQPLFDGAHAPLPWTTSAPERLSPELAVLAARGRANGDGPWGGLGWIRVDDLVAEAWSTTELLVGARAPAAQALLFEDGARAFPTTALEAALGERWEAARIRDRSTTVEAPVDWRNVRGHELSRLAPEHAVPVTWVETIASYAEGRLADAVAALPRWGPADALRLVFFAG